MCGLVAWISGPHSDVGVVRRVMAESAIRGIHAFGVAMPGKQPRKFFRLGDALDCMTKPPMIFHNRYSTSGDWREHLNNQPLFREGVSLAFNGTLDMRSKREMEIAHGVKLHTSNDGELPLIAYLDGGVEGLRSFIAQSKGSFAGILITKSKIIALRNARRPLWLHAGSSLVIASTEDILKRAGLTSHNEQLEHGKVYEWTI